MFNESPAELKKLGGRRSFVGIFGKHRAWADHMDDMGMESPSLREFKQWLYLDGIRQIVDAGGWSNLEKEKKISQWNHRFLIVGEKGMLLAKCWDSVDKRGRGAYPMVAALHVATGRLPASLSPMWELFDKIQLQCEEASEQDEVKQIALSIPRFVDEAMRELSPMPEEGVSVPSRQQFLASSAFGNQEGGLCRFLYNMSIELKGFAGKRDKSPRSRSFRLPLAQDMGDDALLVYLALVKSQIAARYHVTLCIAPGGERLDIFVGDVDPAQIYNIRLTDEALPLVTEVPYNIPDDIQNIIRDTLGCFSAEPLDMMPIVSNPETNRSTSSFFGSLMNRFTRE